MKMKKIISNIIKNLLIWAGIVFGNLFRLLGCSSKLRLVNFIKRNTDILGDRFYMYFFYFFKSFSKVLFDGYGLCISKKKDSLGSTLSLDLSEKTQRIIYLHKLYETDISRFVINNLKVNDTFVDVGANVGYFSVLASKITGPDGTVISFEPDEDNFNVLYKNKYINSFDNLGINNVAVGSCDGNIILNRNPLNSGGHSIEVFKSYKDDNLRFSKEEVFKTYPDFNFKKEVEVRRLSSFFSDNFIKHVDIMKIDVEGYELDVVSGLGKYISSGIIKVVICEISNVDNRDSLMNLFLDNNYKPFRANLSGDLNEIKDNNCLTGNIVFKLSK